jgi:predicted CDP-diglyceride synthetase/phosphatidate cytidylyltransferase
MTSKSPAYFPIPPYAFLLLASATFAAKNKYIVIINVLIVNQVNDVVQYPKILCIFKALIIHETIDPIFDHSTIAGLRILYVPMHQGHLSAP